MKRWMCLIVVAVALSVVAIAAAQENDAVLLHDLLTDPACERLCFMGIEPGMTTRRQLDALLKAWEVNPEQDRIGFSPLIDYFVLLDEPVPPLKPTGLAFTVSSVVEVIYLNFEPVYVAELVGVFGPPTHITQAHDYTALMIYEDLGAIFFVWMTRGRERFGGALIAPERFVEVDANAPLLQPCEKPALLCGLATTTPPTGQP